MKTKEFIKRVEELGYDVELYPSHVFIKTSNISVATVYTQRLYEIYTRSIVKVELTHKEELFDLIIKYAKTPIEEREEPKKYYLMHKWIQKNDYNYLTIDLDDTTYYLDDIEGYDWSENKFTHEEIDEIKEKYNTDLRDFDIVEVEE